jgi:signal peptidase II
LIYIILTGIVLFLDQVTKYWALEKLTGIETIPIIQDVFHLTFRRNTGAAFSILRDNVTLLIGMTSVVILALGVFYGFSIIRKEHPLMLVSLGMILGGAAGNLIDRIRLGYVVDFFDFRLINFAVFNVGDSFIVIGALLIGVYVVVLEGRGSKELG